MILVVTICVIVGIAAVLCCIGGKDTECQCDRCRQKKDE